MDEFTLIWVRDGYDLMIPKGLTNMNREKAIGLLEWTRRTMTKDYRCFIYDPSNRSIFNGDGSKNIPAIERLIRRCK